MFLRQRLISWCIDNNLDMKMYRPLKRRRKSTFDVERISDTHYAAKAKVDFESPFRIKKGHYEFPIDEKDILRKADELGMDILLPPAHARRQYVIPSVPNTDLDSRLYPHQLEGVQRAAAWKRAMIGDEMGVGKSAQAIALAKHFGGRVCIVCPSYLKHNWMRECAFWHPDLDIAPVKKQVPPISIIVSYDLTFRRDLGRFCAPVPRVSAGRSQLLEPATLRNRCVEPMAARHGHDQRRRRRRRRQASG